MWSYPDLMGMIDDVDHLTKDDLKYTLLEAKKYLVQYKKSHDRYKKFVELVSDIVRDQVDH